MHTRPLLPAVPGSCHACRHGCTCRDGEPGCGHYGCRGTTAPACPVATAEAAAYAVRSAALRRQRAVLDARRTAWRTGALAPLP